MVKNNIIALGAHTAICIMTIFIYSILFNSDNHIKNVFQIIGFMAIIIIFIYISIGYCLRIQETRLKNLLSVSILLIFILHYGVSQNKINPVSGIFLYSIHPLFLTLKTYNNEISQYVFLTLGFLPTILLWIGIELKSKMKKMNQAEKLNIG